MPLQGRGRQGLGDTAVAHTAGEDLPLMPLDDAARLAGLLGTLDNRCRTTMAAGGNDSSWCLGAWCP